MHGEAKKEKANERKAMKDAMKEGTIAATEFADNEDHILDGTNITSEVASKETRSAEEARG